MTPYQSAARNNDLSYVAQAMEVRSKTTHALEEHALAHVTCVVAPRGLTCQRARLQSRLQPWTRPKLW